MQTQSFTNKWLRHFSRTEEPPCPGDPESSSTRKVSHLKFVNRTSRTVNVLWIDDDGDVRYYKTLRPYDSESCLTFDDISWICEDLWINRLLLNKQQIFRPKLGVFSVKDDGTPRHFVPMMSDQQLIEKGDNVFQRERVNITLPVFSLSKASAQVIVQNIHSTKDIMHLGLPKQLQSALVSLCHNISRRF